MKILVTGAKGFVGKNLVAALNNVKDGKDRTHPELNIEEIFEYDIDNTESQLDEYASKADFVFNLAGVNRPQNEEEFMKLLYMPEAMVIYRFYFEGIGMTDKWWNKFSSLSDEKKAIIKPIIESSLNMFKITFPNINYHLDNLTINKSSFYIENNVAF